MDFPQKLSAIPDGYRSVELPDVSGPTRRVAAIQRLVPSATSLAGEMVSYRKKMKIGTYYNMRTKLCNRRISGLLYCSMFLVLMYIGTPLKLPPTLALRVCLDGKNAARKQQ